MIGLVVQYQHSFTFSLYVFPIQKRAHSDIRRTVIQILLRRYSPKSGPGSLNFCLHSSMPTAALLIPYSQFLYVVCDSLHPCFSRSTSCFPHLLAFQYLFGFLCSSILTCTCPTQPFTSVINSGSRNHIYLSYNS